ncbi:type II toxin-antitoxin system VapC family toxin [Elioraea tepidiphila]|uniref:type II toxin-antitoxin system VapC family toxin n=1 Tax=Elioraea tepidiphila TaxID=457934 RepID=UPI0004B33A34|nr:type II toxin-antitoxin system VapC family toxin [Elioraea tepidiphila]
MVDASMAVPLFVEEPASGPAGRLFADPERLVVPDIFRLEVMAALARRCRRGEIAPADVVAGGALLDRLGLVAVPHGPLLGEALRLSLDRCHPLQDCVYLVLARRREAALATCDATLAALAEHLSIPLWSHA